VATASGEPFPPDSHELVVIPAALIFDSWRGSEPADGVILFALFDLIRGGEDAEGGCDHAEGAYGV
jgi:hypothetical protein